MDNITKPLNLLIEKKSNRVKSNAHKDSNQSKDKKKNMNTNVKSRFKTYSANFKNNNDIHTLDDEENGNDDDDDDGASRRNARSDSDTSDDDEENTSAYFSRSVFTGMIRVVENNQALLSKREDTVFILDTGCQRYNICTVPTLLSNVTSSTVTIVGVAGQPMHAKEEGILPFCGRTLSLPDADANLISVAQILTLHPGSTVSISHDEMQILSSNGEVMLHAPREPRTNFWTCSYKDLVQAEQRFGNTTDKKEIRNINNFPAYPAQAPLQDSHGVVTPLQLPNTAHLDGTDQNLLIDDDDIPPVIPNLPIPRSSDEWVVTPHPLPPQDRPPGHHLTAEELRRASEAWKLCALLGHPGFDKISRDLDNNCYPDTYLTSMDVRNAVNHFGACPACVEAKMRPPPEPTSVSPPAQTVGEHLHGDIIPFKQRTLGGHTCALLFVDEKSGYLYFAPLPSKHTSVLVAACHIMLNFFRSHGHVTRKISTDSENNLKAMDDSLAKEGIVYTPLPPGLHEKRIERYVQTLKRRRDAILASLSYVMPPQLEAELYSYAVNLHNRTSNKCSHPLTPYQLVTRQRPTLPQFYFGQIGIFYNNKRQNNPHTRGDWGIFLGDAGHPKSFRAFIPPANAVYIRRKFVPHHVLPPEWNLTRRIQPHGNHPLRRVASSPGGILSFPPPPSGGILDMHPTLPPPHPPPLPSGGILTPPPALPAIFPPSLPLSTTPQLPTSSNPSAPPPSFPIPPSTAQEGVLPRAPNGPLPAPPATSKSRLLHKDQEGVSPASGGEVALRRRKEMNNFEVDPDAAVRKNPHRNSKSHQGWKHGRYMELYHTETKSTINYAFRISFKKAMKMVEEYPGIADAAKEEVRNLMNNKVLQVMQRSAMHRGEKAIPVHMFFTFKTKADGSFDKIKARMVANGDQQDQSTIEETFSPTVNAMCVFIIISIAARHGLRLSSHDVKGAFLLSKVPKHRRIIIVIRGELADLFVTMYPEFGEFLTETGELYFMLLRFLYGLPEASNQFYNFIQEKLIKAGYHPTRADSCTFVSEDQDENGKFNYVTIHVDDMLFATSSDKTREKFESAMREFCDLSSQNDSKLSYLGLNINQDFKNKIIRVDQTGFAKALVDRSGCSDDPVRKPPATPATNAIVQSIEQDDNEMHRPLNAKEHKDFRSLVMAIMFLARMTRPDLLFATTVLASFAHRPLWKHMLQVYRVLHYIHATLHYGLIFRGDQPICPVIYADASHGLHPNTGQAHGGIIITFGSAPVLTRSFKVSMITKSSSESELVVLDEAAAYAVWLRLLMYELKIYDNVPRVKIFQDNKSAITMAHQDVYNFKRSKHLLIKYNFVKQHIDAGDIFLEYLPTKDMLADILTKPATREILLQALEGLSMTSNSSHRDDS